jgi:hypothetical protein
MPVAFRIVDPSYRHAPARRPRGRPPTKWSRLVRAVAAGETVFVPMPRHESTVEQRRRIGRIRTALERVDGRTHVRQVDVDGQVGVVAWLDDG